MAPTHILGSVIGARSGRKLGKLLGGSTGATIGGMAGSLFGGRNLRRLQNMLPGRGGDDGGEDVEPTSEDEARIYAVSTMSINADNDAETSYLSDFSDALGLDPAQFA